MGSVRWIRILFVYTIPTHFWCYREIQISKKFVSNSPFSPVIYLGYHLEINRGM